MQRKSTWCGIIFCLSQLIFCQGNVPVPGPSSAPAPAAVPAELAFQEIWAYVLAEDQGLLTENLPLTDIAYFSAGINNKGELFGGLRFDKIPKTKARRHLVVAQLGNAALMHFVLAPEYTLRDKLVKDLGERAKNFDGIQIDFEDIANHDRSNFHAFLELLKLELKGKILSVALPARARPSGDAFAYTEIAPLVDRVFVMAYDEHWSGSRPGSVASLAWCGAVAAYASKVIGTEKLVMGLPFYGRVWAEKNPAGAYRHSSMEKLQKENSSPLQRDAEGIPYFNFSTTINYTAYYEDLSSTTQRAGLYRNASIGKIGFWRLGQEDPAIWKTLKLNPPE